MRAIVNKVEDDFFAPLERTRTARPSTKRSSRSPHKTTHAAAHSTTACSPQQQPQRATKTARFRFRVRRQAPYDTTAPP